MNPSLRLLKIIVIAAALAAAVTVRAAPEEVTYLMPAPVTLPAFAPWMIAQQQGYYADENIKVKFESGKGGVDVAKQLGAGNALIGGAIGDTPIIVRANGVPVKAVAVLGAGSLTQLAVHDAGPIKSVKDIKGRTITVWSYTDTTYYALLGSLKIANLGRDDVDVQSVGPTGVWQLFVTNKSEAMAAVPEWVVSAEDAGAKIRLLADAEMFPSMAQAILASDEAIKSKPDLIKRMVRATLRGMQDIINSPKTAAAVYAKAVPSFQGKEATVERIFMMYRDRVYGQQKTLGEMDPKRLEAVQKFYVQQGIVAKPSPLNDLYTNQFIGTSR